MLGGLQKLQAGEQECWEDLESLTSPQLLHTPSA